MSISKQEKEVLKKYYNLSELEKQDLICALGTSTVLKTINALDLGEKSSISRKFDKAVDRLRKKVEGDES